MYTAIETEPQYQPIASLLCLSCAAQKLREAVKELPSQSLSHFLETEMQAAHSGINAIIRKIEGIAFSLNAINTESAEILAQRQREQEAEHA